MKKNDKNFNAISTFTSLSKKLEDSENQILRFYSEDLAKMECTNKNDDPKISSLEEEQKVKEQVENLSAFLKTTPLETLVFVSIYTVETVRSCAVDTRDMSRFFDISNLDFLPLKGCVYSLLQKGLIREVERRHRDEEYRVTSAAERALLDNKPFKVKKIAKPDRYKFCQCISSLIEDRSNENIDSDELWNLVREEEGRNDHLKLVRETMKLLPNVDDRALFYEMCDDFVGNRIRCTDVEVTLSDMYDTKATRFKIAKDIMEQKHALQTCGLAELQPAKFLSEASITLTEKGMQLFLEKDYDLFNTKGGKDKRLTPPDKIPARELFFSEELTKDLDFVKSSLEDSSFVELQKRLEENSLPKGVALLFHGLPGTGKTAAVDMIAKATGRSVYHVDIAASKTCWFGESEKLFKKIFTDYRRMCETEERKPILLFNEADALFSKRRDVDSGNCAQTENALQNILLEEMETLDGILIATTNLCDNFDNAFERRFLFKVKFGQPDKAAKKSIWQSKLPWLTEDDCSKLASQFDLSGGEIDNIVRKSFMEEVLTGNRPTVAMLEAWCKGEKLHAGKAAAIGFNK
ncbi:MAG: ATP-binding protein [Bacteroidales bacterium]|nr:ATP-binding protein [Bacteroidales bacterium]